MILLKSSFLRKAIAMIVMTALLFCPMNQTTAQAQATITKHFESDNAVISFQLQNQWDTGYIAEVMIQNQGEKAIQNWKLEAQIKGSIDSIWNATQENQKELTIITHDGRNSIIKAGEHITFGMKVEGADFDDISGVLLRQGKQQAQKNNYEVEYNITQQWENHAIVDVIIHNTASEPITNWQITFPLEAEIINIWNASVTSQTEEGYAIRSQSYNTIIKPGSTVSFGMELHYCTSQFKLPSEETVTSYELDDVQDSDADNKQEGDTTEELKDINWNDKTDSDNDGLPDVYEEHRYYTDKNNRDTDGDGLTDGYEVEIGTDPAMPDTDEDDIDDGDEINKYYTDPLENDTDDDGLIDGDELILTLNPLEPDTDGNGVLDGQEYISQSVDKDNIDSELYENNDAVPSKIELKARGNINRDADIAEYEGYLVHDDPAIIGKPILMKDMELESGTIQFILSDEYEIPEYTINGSRTNGLVICHNDNQDGDTLPLQTTYDSKTRTLTAKIRQNGIYFVLDAVELFNGLGIDLESTTSQATPRKAAARSATAADSQEVPVKGKADIVFVVDTTISMDYYIVNVKYNLNAFVEELNRFNVAASFALIEFKDITVDGEESTNIKKYGSSCWTSNINKFKKKVEKLETGGGGDIPETPIDALEKARQLKKHASAKKHIILVTDAKYKTDNRYGIKDMDEMIDLLCKDDTTVSVVSHEYRRNDYKKLYEKTGGKFAAVSQNFAEQLLEIAGGVIDETNDGYWIALKGLTPELVKLKEKPTLTGTADKDKDGLLDREELRNLTPVKYISTPSYLKALQKAGGVGKEIPVYDYYSHPNRKDTEHDGIMDKDDNRPKVKGIYSAKEKKVVLGEMTIVSCANLPTGHAFFVYKSYVNDTLNFKKFTGGYEYKTWKKKGPCKYKIKASEYVSIGNAGKGICGSSASSESNSQVNDGDDAGIYFNREFANEHAEGKPMYNLNCAYKREISAKQLKKIIKVCEDKNYYNLISNNCAKVAVKAWNKAYPRDIFPSHVLPATLKEEIQKKLGSFYFNLAKEVPDIR